MAERYLIEVETNHDLDSIIDMLTDSLDARFISDYAVIAKV